MKIFPCLKLTTDIRSTQIQNHVIIRLIVSVFENLAQCKCSWIYGVQWRFMNYSLTGDVSVTWPVLWLTWNFAAMYAKYSRMYVPTFPFLSSRIPDELRNCLKSNGATWCSPCHPLAGSWESQRLPGEVKTSRGEWNNPDFHFNSEQLTMRSEHTWSLSFVLWRCLPVCIVTICMVGRLAVG